MGDELTRRRFVGAAAGVVAAGVAASKASAEEGEGKKIKIIGICCSPRKGKTTAVSLRVCLQAAQEVSPRIEAELIELAGMKIPGQVAAGIPLDPGEKDDFPSLVPKLSDPEVGGIIIGTPVYFGNMTALCKSFLDRCMVFRKSDFALRDKVAGVLAVGGARNGGQEITIQSVQAALLCQDIVIVGDGKPTARIGATVWSGGKGEVTEDEFGMTTAKDLGRRVAELALRLAGTAK